MAENLLNWPVVGGALTCECGAPAVEERSQGSSGPLAAYTVGCTVCWRRQTVDPTSTRWKKGPKR